MLTLIRGAHLLAPEDLGTQDVLIAAGSIIAIGTDLNLSGAVDIEVIDARGQYLTPGLVDTLTHITGGGGQGGFHTRTPAMTFSDAIGGGVTTVTGVLGTDAISRTLPDLLAKAAGLEILDIDPDHAEDFVIREDYFIEFTPTPSRAIEVRHRLGEAGNTRVAAFAWPHDLLLLHFDDEITLSPGAPVTKNGYMFVNEAPGLGIDIDEEKAARYPLRDYNYDWTQVRKQDGTPVRP